MFISQSGLSLPYSLVYLLNNFPNCVCRTCFQAKLENYTKTQAFTKCNLQIASHVAELISEFIYNKMQVSKKFFFTLWRSCNIPLHFLCHYFQIKLCANKKAILPGQFASCSKEVKPILPTFLSLNSCIWSYMSRLLYEILCEQQVCSSLKMALPSLCASLFGKACVYAYMYDVILLSSIIPFYTFTNFRCDCNTLFPEKVPGVSL